MRALFLFALILVIGPATTVADEKKRPLERRVNIALARSAANLVSRQAEDGSWQKGDKHHPLGRTALCTYALLHAGYPQDHPAVKKALAFLSIGKGYALQRMPISTYEASCLVLLLNALGRGYEKSIHAVCQWLVDNFNRSVGLWGYPKGIADLSNTQFAAMALKAGARHGFETPKKLWKRLVDSVLRLQHESGAIRYTPGTVYRATMTHAGLLVLRFAHEALETKPPRKVKDAMERAHRWIEKTYDVERNPLGTGWSSQRYYYYMYGLERYAQFFGFAKIAGHDWYREGAEVLLERQKKDGSWGSLEETAFAILFLRRATLSEPVAQDLGDGDDEEGREPPKRPHPARKVPSLRTWLVAGPFPGTKFGDDHFDIPHLDTKRAHPREGGRAGRRKWRKYVSPKDRVNLKKATGGGDWASYFAATWLFVEKDLETHFWFGSDDGIRVYLDGEQVLFGNHRCDSGNDFYRLPLTLTKGRHLLLVHVSNLNYGSYVRARISDPKGQPIEGIRASTSAANK
ncbi:MAG: prenyltransferase/squalene oxidase repeat-containing protein [Planctomycetota bacterium]